MYYYANITRDARYNTKWSKKGHTWMQHTKCKSKSFISTMWWIRISHGNYLFNKCLRRGVIDLFLMVWSMTFPPWRDHFLQCTTQKSLVCPSFSFFPTIFIKILQSLSCVKIIIFHSLLLLVSPLWTTLGSFASPLADRQIKMIDLRNATPKSWWFDLKTCDFTSLTSFSVI